MKRKTPEGHKVFFPYSNDKVFQPAGRFDGKWVYSGTPTREFHTWIREYCGPLGVLWTSEKTKDRTGLEIYFLVPAHAMLAKLTWL